LLQLGGEIVHPLDRFAALLCGMHVRGS
jgi:hypothetical protein